MLYKQFLKITDSIGKENVEAYDYWLGTLPRAKQENISASVVSSSTGISYEIADFLLKYSKDHGIIKEYYLVLCPNDECEKIIKKIEFDEIADVLQNKQYCSFCDHEYDIYMENIYQVYRRIKDPDLSPEEVKILIEKRVFGGEDTNFRKADERGNVKIPFQDIYYHPSESAYQKLGELREKLDDDYGNNKTEKGSALEKLSKELFNLIKFVKASSVVESSTNQFDCTVVTKDRPIYPSIADYMSPYFIIECKNEDCTPKNNYLAKLIGIIEKNDARLGILWSRKRVPKTFEKTVHDHYISKKYAPKQEVIISFDDDDLKILIDQRANLLDYLEYKVHKVTMDASKMTWEEYRKEFGRS